MRKIFGDDFPAVAIDQWAAEEEADNLPENVEEPDLSAVEDRSVKEIDSEAAAETSPISRPEARIIRSCTHTLIFPKKTQAVQFAEELKAYETSPQIEQGEGGEWQVYVSHRVAPDEDVFNSETLEALAQELTDLAIRHGGEYMMRMTHTTSETPDNQPEQ
jgi:hypothetical protein